MQLTTEDRVLIKDSLSHLCQELQAGSFARPEQVCSKALFAESLQRCSEMGVINLSAEAGCGLWEDVEDPANLTLTLDNLATLASTNAALAFGLHRMALAKQLLTHLHDPGIDGDATTLCLHGRHGLGRGGLAAWWQNRGTDADLLHDVFDQGSPRLALMHGNACQVMCPVFSDDGLSWRLCTALDNRQGMGLDELALGQLDMAGGRTLVLKDEVAARALSRTLWCQDWLGLLAIQQGCAIKAVTLARDYSRLRYQGGQVIAGHAAVQMMLADCGAALADVADFLARQTLSPAAFGRLLLARNHLQQDLCRAVNNAMQIFGGIGYMRDTGIEKCFRDINQLRLQSGGPLDMQLLAAEWEQES